MLAEGIVLALFVTYTVGRLRRVVRERGQAREAAVAHAVAVLSGVSRSCGLGEVSVHGVGSATVRGRVDGVAVEVTCEHDGTGGVTRITATPRATLVHEVRARSALNVGFAVDASDGPIERTGDGDFDATFVVHADSAAATAVLSDDVRATLLVLSQRGGIALESCPDRVTVVWHRPPDAAAVERTLDLVASLVRRFDATAYR